MPTSSANAATSKYAWSLIARTAPPKRGAAERVADYREIYSEYDEATVREQASRCIQCPNALCAQACPLTNRIPRVARPRCARPVPRGRRHFPFHEQHARDLLPRLPAGTALRGRLYSQLQKSKLKALKKVIFY